MKYVLVACLSASLMFNCKGPGKKEVKQDSAALKDSIARLDPEKPHEVMKGKGADYAFKPDTAIQSLVLGNPECFSLFYRNNGANRTSLGGTRGAMVYTNSSVNKEQLMEVRVTENKKGQDVIYAMIVQWNGDENAPKLSGKEIPSSEFNFMSGHGIYIGMPKEYVMKIYSNQSFMEWEKGDTVYLEYKPKPKDGGYFKRYTPASYSVLYKFVDESLRRMEYYVDPAQFENK